MKKKKECPNKLLTILMVVCVVLSVVILGIVSYDKFLKKKEKEEIKPATCNCPVCENNSNLGEKVSSVKKINLNSTNQKVVIGSKTLNLKVDKNGNQDDVLYINNEVAKSYCGNDMPSTVVLVPPVAYLTDKYVFFTSVGQDDDGIVYAIDENAKEIVVNGNGYQMHDFKIVDGYIHATGHVFRGLVDDNPDKDLIIKFLDNTLIVTEAK